jgi:hypothetical protein
MPSECTGFDLPVTSARALKRATGPMCEICGCPSPADLLELHLVPGPPLAGGVLTDPGRVLVLCPACHQSLHAARISARK